MSKATVKFPRPPSSTSLDWEQHLSLWPLLQPSHRIPGCHATPHQNLEQPTPAHQKHGLPPLTCTRQVTPHTTQTGIVEDPSRAYDTLDDLAILSLSTTKRLIGRSSRRSLNWTTHHIEKINRLFCLRASKPVEFAISLSINKLLKFL